MCVCARARVCVHARACVCVYVHVCAVLQSRSEGLGPRTVGLVMRRSLLPDLDGSSVPPKARASSAVMSCSPFKSMCAAAVADRWRSPERRGPVSPHSRDHVHRPFGLEGINYSLFAVFLIADQYSYTQHISARLRAESQRTAVAWFPPSVRHTTTTTVANSQAPADDAQVAS